MIKKAARYITMALVLAAASLPMGAYITHTVEKGETLWGISHKYNVSADAIIELNPSVSTGLKAGVTITIPEEGDLKKVEPREAAGCTEAQNAPNRQDYPQDTNVDNGHASMPVLTELPIIRSDSTPGRDVYVARFGDTFESISKRTGVSARDLAAFNPLTNAYAVPEGEIIRLSASSPYKTNKAILSIVDSVVYRVEMPAQQLSVSPSQDNALALLLPFDLSHDEISRQSLLATDFYKGFLIATNENSKGVDKPLRIYAVDTQCSDDDLQDKLIKLAAEGVKIIVPTDDMRQTEIIEKFATENGIAVVNILNIKDEGYLAYPNVIQCNISQKLMYDKAINTLLTDFEDFTPVVLDLVDGKDEKLSFIDELRTKYSDQGKEVLDLTFEHMLSESDLAEALAPDQKYIFIPKSGSIDVFERFYNALSSYMGNDSEYGRLKLFGYPDWVTFRGDSEEALHRMGAVIYSRFYFNPSNTHVEAFNTDFARWYGAPQNDVFPAQGTMGYDAGNMLYRMIKDGWLDSTVQSGSIGNYDGIQSAFHLKKMDGVPGVVNDALYIIEFIPEGQTYAKII